MWFVIGSLLRTLEQVAISQHVRFQLERLPSISIIDKVSRFCMFSCWVWLETLHVGKCGVLLLLDSNTLSSLIYPSCSVVESCNMRPSLRYSKLYSVNKKIFFAGQEVPVM